MGKHKKFEMSEIVVGSLFALAVDTIAALLDLTGLGYIVATPLQGLMSLITSLWLKAKGGKKTFKITRQSIKQLSNFLPIIPTTTTSFIIETMIHNKKK